MELDDIVSVNELFKPIYPYIARQIAAEYGRAQGQALEIGPYGPGISIELARLLPQLKITVGDDNSQINDYLKEETRKAGLADSIEVKEIDKYQLPFSQDSFDLVYFRGALFFWEGTEKILKEAYRMLKPSGLAMLGGGFGADTPEELVNAIVPRSRELNRRLAKVVLSEADVKKIIEEAGLAHCSSLDTRRGLWILVRK